MRFSQQRGVLAGMNVILPQTEHPNDLVDLRVANKRPIRKIAGLETAVADRERERLRLRELVVLRSVNNSFPKGALRRRLLAVELSVAVRLVSARRQGRVPFVNAKMAKAEVLCAGPVDGRRRGVAQCINLRIRAKRSAHQARDRKSRRRRDDERVRNLQKDRKKMGDSRGHVGHNQIGEITARSEIGRASIDRNINRFDPRRERAAIGGNAQPIRRRPDGPIYRRVFGVGQNQRLAFAGEPDSVGNGKEQSCRWVQARGCPGGARALINATGRRAVPQPVQRS